MNKVIFVCLAVCMIGIPLFCQNNNILNTNQKYSFIESDSLTGSNLSDFTFDRNGILWVVSTKYYPSTKPNPFSNFPMIWFVSKIEDNKYYTIKDSLEVKIKNIVFDKFNTLHILCSKQIITLNNESKFVPFFVSSEIGGFNSLAFDNNNNIWVGGLQTGILMYDGNTWSTYNTENSSLPTNSSTNIFIDNNNIKWLTLWEKKGILKIEDNQWTYFTKEDSDFLNNQFWSITVDLDNNLWIGTGWLQSPVKVVEYNGNKWFINNPTNVDGKSISGTIRTLITDIEGNIWSVSSISRKRSCVGSILSKYDGNNWQNIEIDDVNIIRDIEIDKNGNIWILSQNRIIQVTE